jgi:hypothetical protein
MDSKIADLRAQTIEKILARQDDSFRWGFNEKQARERPQCVHYSPNFKSTLWTLVLLADLKAPLNTQQIHSSIRLITEHFYDPEYGLFRLPGMSHFPIPCLNGNLLYIHHYFKTPHSERIDKTIAFFASHQRFDDGNFLTPTAYPYFSNVSCYGKHTCYWGVTKLFKGLCFIPKTQRTRAAQQTIDHCVDFVLQHEVCFSSHHPDKFLHPEISKLTFPNFYHSDFLELLWIMAREEVNDGRLSRALDLLRSRMKNGGTWELEKSLNAIVPSGQKDRINLFISERANEVLDFYGHEK